MSDMQSTHWCISGISDEQLSVYIILSSQQQYTAGLNMSVSMHCIDVQCSIALHPHCSSIMTQFILKDCITKFEAAL